MGKPVVASEVGVIPEYLDGAGLLYPEGDTTALAQRILDLLADGSLARKLGSEGRRRVEQKYNWTEVARRTVGLYEEILKS
jgi:glycosyltransferase involved in cell wall biosynthesis